VTDDDIEVALFLALIWRRKLLLTGIALLSLTLGLTYVLLAEPRYTAQAVLTSNVRDEGPNLPQALSGLAGFAGINLGGSADGTEALATLRSRVFAEEFILAMDLMPLLFPDAWDQANERWIASEERPVPDLQEGVDRFVDGVLSIEEDPVTGLITCSIEWFSPEQAAMWLDEFIARINERIRTRDLMESELRLEFLNRQLEQMSLVELRQAVGRLIESEIQTIMLAQAKSEYAFRVIDPPRVPYEPTSPRKILIIVVSAFGGVVIGGFFILALLIAQRLREILSQTEPEK